MSSLPIACNLSASDLVAAKQRYRAAADRYQATIRISDDHADIALTGDKPALNELLAAMIERENACCSFLVFDVAETAGGFDVRLGIVDGAGMERDILTEAAGILFPTTE
jgi:hypothetical protein